MKALALASWEGTSSGSLALTSGLEGARASGIVSQAYSAALKGKDKECSSFIWALRDLPRDEAVMHAVNEGHGDSKRTLLHVASKKGLEESVKLLLGLPAKLTKDANGQTALHMAAIYSFPEVAQLLLTHGRAHVDVRDANGCTPLHIAAKRGRKGVARMLMRFGANPEAIDAAGKTPLSLAKDNQVLSSWLQQFVQKRNKITAGLRQVPLVKALGKELPSHIVAPKLKLTPVGYCPVDENGNVIQLARGIRCNTSRKGPSAPRNRVNWYCPRG